MKKGPFYRAFFIYYDISNDIVFSTTKAESIGLLILAIPPAKPAATAGVVATTV